MIKKLSNIFYLVNIIITSILIATYLGIAIFSVAGLQALYASGALNITLPPEYAGVISVEQYVNVLSVNLAVIFFSLTVFSILSLIFTIIARKDETKKMHIVALVFSALTSGATFGIAGAILGLIYTSKENN